MDFTDAQIERYARHIILPEVGGIGQEKLLNSRVLVVGAGGLGSPLLLYLAAAGIGTIGVIDNDVVDLSNLQRQIVHDTGTIGMPKVASAEARLKAINPEVRLEAHQTRLTAANVMGLIANTTSSPTGRTISRPASCWPTPAISGTGRWFPPPCCGSTGSYRPSSHIWAAPIPAIAASSANLPRAA